MNGKTLRNDIILVVLVLAAAVGAWCFTHFRGSAGSRVEVTVDGSIYLELDLSRDGQWDVDNEYGHNHIVIKDGGVSMTEADCPDKVCVNMGVAKTTGQTIVCLPHKLVIKVVGDDGLDGVSQ
jgi:hypothetical protein